MANFWSGLDPVLQGAMIAGLFSIIGTIIGAVTTVLLSPWWRRRGSLRYRSSAWTYEQNAPTMESRGFTLGLFNERAIGTALWNPRFLFYKDGKEWVDPRRPTDRETEEPVVVLGLPPWEPVSKELSIGFDKLRGDMLGDELRKVKESDRIVFVADIPGKGEGAFKEQMPLWDAHKKLRKPWQQLRL